MDSYRGHTQPKESLETPEALGFAEDLLDDDGMSDLFPSVRAMVTNVPEQDRQVLVLTEYIRA
ncbi:MAG: hypothetical protein H0U76_06785 [Ktedonobacteraceae bacterium]|nr:hypothetical protein [Ktedonobacteraceae bacterium]